MSDPQAVSIGRPRHLDYAGRPTKARPKVIKYDDLSVFGVASGLALVLVCAMFVAGVVVLLVTPRGDEGLGGAMLALFLMVLPPLLLSPLGVLLGLAGMIATCGRSRRAAVGLIGNLLISLAGLGWRFL